MEEVGTATAISNNWIAYWTIGTMLDCGNIHIATSNDNNDNATYGGAKNCEK
jgi:hypothetical protein